jgi:hypothetical protein
MLNFDPKGASHAVTAFDDAALSEVLNGLAEVAGGPWSGGDQARTDAD